MFEFYWKWLGLPLSRFKGLLVDSVPFSLVETVIWLGLASTLIWIGLLIRGRSISSRRSWISALCGPVLLMSMGMCQGAFPWSLAPSAWRQPLSQLYAGAPLPYDKFLIGIKNREASLNNTFSPHLYQALSEEEILYGCDRALDRVLERLDLPPGRSVKNIKPMGPLTTLLGLSYGGPAFHDPFLGEAALIKPEEMPSTRYWRLIAVCHESAHAKGFTREMDAEILTQLALSTSADPRYRLLGDIMFLRKSGLEVQLPQYLQREIRDSHRLRKRAEENQVLVRRLKKLAERLNFRNDPDKYGSRSKNEPWNPHHPFFTTLVSLLASPKFIGGVDG